MKYKIIVEGGFAGISREYEGEVELTPEETKSILEGMNEGGGFQNQDIRDGFSYVIKIENDNEVLRRKFEEGNMPRSIRNFMDRVRQTNRKSTK